MNQAVPDHVFHIEFESAPLAVRAALADVLTGLEPLALEGEELGTVELVIAEALNNIVEHAYPEGDTPGPVRIDCARRVTGLHFRIEDEGRPMPDGRLPLGEAANVDVAFEDMPEGGFGWFLIRDLAKDVGYAREGACNVLTLRLAMAIPG